MIRNFKIVKVNYKYCDYLDIIKINRGKYGVVNFNNMIPVISNNYEIFDLNKIPDNDDELKRINLLKSQVLWLNKNKKNVYKKAISLYDKYHP